MSFKERKAKIIEDFKDLSSQEIYQKLIQLGSQLNMLTEEERASARKVSGCQSQMYIQAHFNTSKVSFKLYSDALISAGIGALLLNLYNDLTPEEILKSDITFLKDLGIIDSLSAGRSNGLASLYLNIKNLVIPFLS